jgi:trk system potassium uptake protein TrkH
MRTRPVLHISSVGRLRDRFEHFAAATPARFAILIFGVLILVFTLIFSMPISTTSGEVPPFADALFTAVSVICVTGLSTVDMASYWSPFGHGVILLGVQIGGIGVLTLASILGLVISRKLGLRQRLLAAGDSNPLRMHKGSMAEGQAVRLGEVGSLLVTVALSVLVIEFAVAVLLFPRLLASGIPPLESAWEAFYYSAMAFTNTGFQPTSNGLVPFAQDYWFLSVLMIGVFLGAVGFPVIYVLMRNMRRPKKWSLHVKLTLTTTILLFVLGGIAFFLLELGNAKTFGSMDLGQRIFQPFFLSMMTRSGGFNTIDINELNGSSLLVADMLMFIGGGSASTAGGIKVTTLAILFLAAFAEARGNEGMQAFDRRIPSDVLRLSVSVVLWGATTVAAASIIILQISGATLDRVLFEVISAFATSGLSTGLTAELPNSGQYVLAATMFLGRVGTVTLAAALAASQSRQLFRRSEERPIVG